MEELSKARIRFIFTAVISISGGILIFIIDSSNGWDDTGITVGMLLLLSAFCGYLSPKKFWLWALLSGVWIPLNGIIKNNDPLFLFILLITFAGSLAGAAMRKAFQRRKD